VKEKEEGRRREKEESLPRPPPLVPRISPDRVGKQSQGLTERAERRKKVKERRRNHKRRALSPPITIFELLSVIHHQLRLSEIWSPVSSFFCPWACGARRRKTKSKKDKIESFEEGCRSL